MAQKESSFINMLLTLVGVTLVASLSLGFVYNWTKEPIAKANRAKQIKAIKEVMGSYNNDPLTEMFKVVLPGQNDSLEFFPAKIDGKLTGMAIKTVSQQGYSGEIWLMVGFDTAGNILNISVIRHAETPGLGSKMSMPFFVNQYIGKNPGTVNLKVKKDGGSIDAISGATITSRAYSEAVQRAYDTYQSWSHGKQN